MMLKNKLYKIALKDIPDEEINELIDVVDPVTP